METDPAEALRVAGAALRQGDRDAARRAVKAALRADPTSVAAWSLACRLSTSREEQRYCLERILALEPDHAGARRALAQLQAAPTATAPASAAPAPPRGRSPLLDFLLFPLEWVLRSPVRMIIGLIVLFVLGGLVYLRANTSFFGLTGPDFNSLTISPDYNELAAGDFYWQVTYEKPTRSEFAGLIRYVGPIRERTARILTHDILVTSGDYANPALVRTRVSNHHFTWWADSQPQGRINLLHTVPANEELYRQLLELREGDQVTITGIEILQIRAYRSDGTYLGEWHDTGCNTLLVETVSRVVAAKP